MFLRTLTRPLAIPCTLALLLCAASTIVSAEPATPATDPDTPATPAESPTAGTFALQVDSGQVTLLAKDSSLREVVLELAEQLELDVADLKLPEEQRIDVRLEALPADEALAALGRRTGHAFFVLPGQREGSRDQLVVLTISSATVATVEEQEPAEPRVKSFRFRVEPTKARRAEGGDR